MKRILFATCAVLALVALLFGYSRWTLSHLESLHPPIGKHLKLDGLALHYVEAGSGPAVVLLHGSSTNLRDFSASIFDPLSRYCRVVAIDRPGHGYSTYRSQFWMDPNEQAHVIRDALRKLGIERAVWLGHSWAGAVVMAGLLEFPSEVTAGVLLGGAAYHWEGGVAFSNHLADIPVVGSLFAHTLLMPASQLLMDRFVDAAFSPNQAPPGYRQRTGVELAARPAQFIINGRDVRLLSDFLLEQSERYQTIAQPLLIVHGSEDDIVPAWNHAERLIELLPQATLSELPETGHLPHHVHPDEVARQIARFACAA